MPPPQLFAWPPPHYADISLNILSSWRFCLATQRRVGPISFSLSILLIISTVLCQFFPVYLLWFCCCLLSLSILVKVFQGLPALFTPVCQLLHGARCKAGLINSWCLINSWMDEGQCLDFTNMISFYPWTALYAGGRAIIIPIFTDEQRNSAR